MSKIPLLLSLFLFAFTLNLEASAPKSGNEVVNVPCDWC